MKRLMLADIITDATGARVPVLPAAATAWVMLADWPARTRCLVKCVLPDGTATTAATIADITFDGEGRQVDINAAALTQAQRDAWRTRLSNAGFPVEDFDGVDRARLLWFILRRLAGRQGMTRDDVLHGYDAG